MGDRDQYQRAHETSIDSNSIIRPRAQLAANSRQKAASNTHYSNCTTPCWLALQRSAHKTVAQSHK